MIYKLNKPDIETIIDYCNDLEANDELEVFDFGLNGDLVLHIYKDEDFNPETEEYNLVAIHVAQNGEWVYDSDDTHVTDGSLYKELDEIYKCKDFDIER